jgi:hypothetical protein
MTLETKWSNLLKPDVAFGESSANHNITVVVDAELQKTLDTILKTSGAKKINGLREVDNVVTFKAKSKVHVDSGKFPCVDSLGQPTDIVPFGGDKVRLKLAPMVLTRDNSLSIYLNGIQVVEKNTTFTKGSDFAAVEGGFVGQSTKKDDLTDQADSDLPY